MASLDGLKYYYQFETLTTTTLINSVNSADTLNAENGNTNFSLDTTTFKNGTKSLKTTGATTTSRYSVSITNGPITNSSSCTISLWFNPSMAQKGRLISITNNNVNDSAGLGYDPSGIFFSFGGDTYTIASNSIIENYGLTTGKWHHLAATYSLVGSQTYVSVYLNGTVIQQSALFGQKYWGATYTPSSVVLFGQSGAISTAFKGNIDEVMIFNRALETTEVMNLYNMNYLNTGQTTLYQSVVAASSVFSNVLVASSGISTNGKIITNNSDINAGIGTITGGNLNLISSTVPTLSGSATYAFGATGGLTCGQITTTGQITVGGNINAFGQVINCGTINVSGTVNASSQTLAFGDITCGNIVATNKTFTCGNINSGVINATGTITATGQTLTCGSITATGTITATGQTITCGSITTTLDASLNLLKCGNISCGNINTTGPINAGSQLLTCGNITCGNIVATNKSLTCGAITATGTITATGQTITCGAITTNGTLTANGQIINCGTISTSGSITSGGALTATNQTLTCGAITTNGTLNATGQTINCGAITATGTITAIGQALTCGDISCNGVNLPGGSSINNDGSQLTIMSDDNIDILLNRFTGSAGKFRIFSGSARSTRGSLECGYGNFNGGIYVDGGYSDVSHNYSYLNANGIGIAGGITTYSIIATGRIGTAGEINVWSDKRIKKNTKKITGKLIETIRKLEPVQFNYIDFSKNAEDKNEIGFIAQDVLAAFPDAVGKNADTIPNIYDVGVLTKSSIITLKNKKTSEFTFDNSPSPNLKIKLFVNNQAQIVYLDKIIDEHSFSLTEPVNTEITDNSDNEVFVYGQEINDLLSIEKNAIFTVAVGAIKELDAELQETKADVKRLQEQVAFLIEARAI